MKRKDILISLAVIAACGGVLYLYSFTNSLVHGYIELDSGDPNIKAELQLRSSFFGREKVVSGSEPKKVNSRILTPRFLTVSKTQKSRRIILASYGPWGDISRVQVENDKKTTIKVGPPFVIKPNVRNRSGIVQIDFSIIGRAGEYYQVPILPKTPKVTIMDENGKTLASGSFSYG
jgi:hypothetical protein